MENSCSQKVKSSLKLCAIEVVLLCWLIPTSLLIFDGNIAQDLVIHLASFFQIFQFKKRNHRLVINWKVQNFAQLYGIKMISMYLARDQKTKVFRLRKYSSNIQPSMKPSKEIPRVLWKNSAKSTVASIKNRELSEQAKIHWVSFDWNREPWIKGEISGALPLFFLMPIAYWSDRRDCRKSMMFIPIVGGILASLGEKNR